MRRITEFFLRWLSAILLAGCGGQRSAPSDGPGPVPKLALVSVRLQMRLPPALTSFTLESRLDRVQAESRQVVRSTLLEKSPVRIVIKRLETENGVY